MPSKPGSARHRLLPRLLIAAACVSSLTAQVPERAYPIEPVDGATHGSRPVFKLGYEGELELAVRKLRFRITLEPLRGPGQGPVFDQRRRSGGWLPGDDGEMLYRPRKPIPDGEYRWRVSTWTGVEWKPGRSAFELRIDTVAPAEVEGLVVRNVTEGVLLEWNPVTLDRNGRPEYVARYHVYRYERGSILPRVKPFEIGVVEQPRFVDRSTNTAPALYYKVTAEDEAGNEPGRRR